MALDPQISDPTAGVDAGTDTDTQGTQPAAPAAPAARSYNDTDMANARRSFESQAKREREAAVAAVRAEYERRNTPQPSTDDPWSQLDPQGQKLMRQILDRELAPFKTFQQQAQERQEDLAFKGEEADLKSKYPDYAKNRNTVLEFAIANNIANPEAAFHAWRSMTQWDSLKSQAVTEHLAKKTAQSARTPSLEGRGGGAPTSRQTFKDKNGKLDRDAMDEAAKELFRAAESE